MLFTRQRSNNNNSENEIANWIEEWIIATTISDHFSYFHLELLLLQTIKMYSRQKSFYCQNILYVVERSVV